MAGVAKSRRAPSRSYALQEGEPLSEGLARVARGRIDHARDELRGRGEGSADRAVHEARKDLKKLRSVLRLARGELGGELYREENAAFRDIGRRLSGARDAQVVIETLDALVEEAGGRKLPKRIVGPLRDRLIEQRDALDREVGGLDEAASRAAEALGAARLRVDDWPLERDGFAAIAPGLERAYRQGRRSARIAMSTPTVPTLHEWRKRVKDHWYHQRLLAFAWPEVIGPSAEQAHRLSELLGDDHDLAVLADAVDLNADAVPASADRARLHREIARRREALQAEAFELGERLYAERPKAYVRRMRHYFKS